RRKDKNYGRILPGSYVLLGHSELDIFEHGSPADLQLNFAIFLFSIAFTAIAALYSASFGNSTAHLVFVIISVVGLIFGCFLLLSWHRSKSTSKHVCSRIRERIKEVLVETTVIPRPVDEGEKPHNSN